MRRNLKGGPPLYRSNVWKTIARKGLFLLQWIPMYRHEHLKMKHRSNTSPQKKIYFYHVQKSAGTSLVKAFESLGGEDPLEVEARMIRPGYTAWTAGHLLVHTGDSFILRLTPFTFAWSHQPFWKVKLPSNTFTVTILRDPIDRIVSLYCYGIDREADKMSRFKASPYIREITSNGFETFLNACPPSLLLNQLYIFSRSLNPDQAASKIRSLSLYFFTEYFSQGMEKLSTETHFTLPIRRERSTSSSSLICLSSSTRHRLREILEPEYQMIEELRRNPGPNFIGHFPS